MRVGIAGHVDEEPPLERRAVEEERLLRQPEERRTRRKRQPGLDAGGRAVAAVDFFRRGRRRFDLGALVQESSTR